MIAEKPFIFYSLPKSRTTQQLIGGRKIEKAWDNVCSFLTNCTITNPEQPTRISLTAYTAFQGDPNPEIADKIIQETKQLFDSGQTEPVSYAYPSGIPDRQTKTEWNIETRDLQKAIDYMVKGQPWPKFTFGPIELLVTFDFKLLDPTTKTELPNQEEKSSLMIWLSRNCVCSPDLYFPFEQADENFKRTIEKLSRFCHLNLKKSIYDLDDLTKAKLNILSPNSKRNDNMNGPRTTTGKTGFASAGLTCKLGALCFYLSSVLIDSFVLRNPPERKARKRYNQCCEPTIDKLL
jgi:hypothetical protein